MKLFKNFVVSLVVFSFVFSPYFTLAQTLDTTLTPGDRHPQVSTLQRILNSIGQKVTEIGKETTYYGSLTAGAIKALQCKYGIVCSGTPETTGFGRVGPRTLALINSLKNSFGNGGRLNQVGAGAVATDGLLYSYSFDGNTADAKSGNNGSANGSPAYVAGKIGQAISLDGVDDYVGTDATKSATLNGLSAVTFSYWIKPTTLSGYPIARWGTNRQFMQTFIGNKLRLYWRVGGSGSTGSTVDHVSNGNISTSAWNHIVVVYNNPTSKIYINGVLDSSQSGVGGKLNDSVADSLSFGRMVTSSATTFFNGSIDDVNIYSRALSDSEISDIYSASGGTPSPSPTPTPDPTPAPVGSYTLTVNKSGSGTVTGTGISCGSDCTENVTSGTSITLTATPSSGSTFTGWSGACSGASTCNVSLTSNKTVTATFTTTAVTPSTAPTGASSYYVSPSGLDTNPGTESQPLKTIQKAADLARAGTTIYVQPGNYPERVSTKNGGTSESSRITFKALGTAVINGFVFNHPYVTLEGFDITGDSTSYYYVEVKAVVKNSVLQSKGDYCKIINNKIRDAVTKTGGINFGGTRGYSADNCLISGNLLSSLRYTFLTIEGNNHRFENNVFQYLNSMDYVRLFGKNHVFYRNVFWKGNTIPGAGNHPDWIQTFADLGGESSGHLFEENYIEGLDGAQLGQVNSGSGPGGDLNPNFKDITFRRNVFANISNNFNGVMPGLKFDHNTFYRFAYDQSGAGFGGSLTRGNASGALLTNNVFVGGSDGSSNKGWYFLSGIGLSEEAIDAFVTKEGTTFEWPIAKAIKNDLVSRNYINSNGKFLPAGLAINDISQFVISDTYASYKTALYNTFKRAKDLDASYKATTNADYNFVAGPASAGYPAKIKRTCAEGIFTDFEFCEIHGVSGGDPKFRSITDLVGPDGKIFTLDDGLKPQAGSALCGKGVGGADIGAYSCDPSKVFATGDSGNVGTTIPDTGVPTGAYSVTVSTRGTGTGSVSGTGISCGTDCFESFTTPTNVTLTATPAAGSSFTGWSGACNGTGNPCTVSVSTVKNVYATFDLGGTTIPPATNKFTVNDRVKVTATTLNVRLTPNGTIQGSQALNAVGTVTAGPTAEAGYVWWNVNFDSGVDGWVAENFIEKNTSVTPPPATTVGGPVLNLNFETSWLTNGVVADISSGGNNATCQRSFNVDNNSTKSLINADQCPNQVSSSATIQNRVAEFSGSVCRLDSDYLGIARNSNLNSLSKGTISVWVNYNPATDPNFSIPNTTPIYQRVLDTYSLNVPRSWTLGKGGTRNTTFNVNNGGSSQTVLLRFPDTDINNAWHLYTVTWDGTNVTGYYDGVPFTGNQVSQAGIPDFVLSEYLAIGALKHNANRNEFTNNCVTNYPDSIARYGYPSTQSYVYPNAGFLNGKLDDVLIYNKPLSASEIKAIYDATVGGLPPATTDTTLPSISITSPANNSTISGSTNLTVSATDNIGVVGVRYLVDGIQVGPEVTSAPFSANWSGMSDGTYTLTAEARDAAGNKKLSAPISVTVKTSTVNVAPVLNSIGNKSIAENSTLTFQLSATDGNGDALTYSGTNLPTGATFTGTTFSWKPSYTQSGTYSVTFTVSDGKGGTDTETITITVTNTNQAPVASAGPDQSISLPSSAILSASGSTDGDGQSLTYSWSKVSGTGNVSFSSNTNIAPTGTFSLAGTYTLRVTVSDGTLSSNDTVTITVLSNPSADDDLDGVLDGVDLCPNSRVGAAVNTRGCPVPKMTKFSTKPSVTSEDLRSMESVELGTVHGKVSWKKAGSPYSLVKITDTSYEPLDLDATLEIKAGEISLKSDLVPELNRPATLTFFNVTIRNPEILKNGVICTECDLSYVGTTLTFTVPGFSTYTIVSNDDPTVSITAPTGGSFTGGTTIKASATDDLGIESVSFYANDNLIGTDTSAPYEVNFEPSAGSYTLTAKARDVGGLEKTSSSVSVTAERRSSGGGGGSRSKGTITSNTSNTQTPSTLTLPTNATREQLISYLVAKIQELLLEYNRIKALEGGSTTNTTDTVLKGFQFTKTFGIGANNSEVRYLQRFLNTHGFPVGTGLGSYGKEVDTFGPVTQATLKKYQLANNIEATGYFGNLTKQKVNQTLLSE